MKTSLLSRLCCGWIFVALMLFLTGSVYAQISEPGQADRENVNVPYPGLTKSTNTAINVYNYTGTDVNNLLHPEKLVTDLLISGCLKASNIQFRGDRLQIGKFVRNPQNPNFPLESGLILSTGKVEDAVGPNSTGSRTTQFSLTGESNLQSLVGNATLYDPSVLTFNFVPDGNVVEFRYIFASDEYPEWACSQFNDVFGFFISGPGISGTVNIAKLPDNSPVSINNIHVGGWNQNAGQTGPSPSTCPDLNGAFYVAVPAGSTTIEYDGRTTVLTARIENLQACGTYSMKIAIADVADRAYDSAVFLEAKSFISTGANIKNFYNMVETYDVFQACEPTEIRIYREGNTNMDEALEIEYVIEGTATSGVHHTLASGVAVIPANEDYVAISYTLPLVALDGTKTIVVKIDQACLCDEQSQWVEKVIRIHDPFVMDFIEVSDATTCIEGTGTIAAKAKAGASNFDYVFTYKLYDSSDNLIATIAPGGNNQAIFANLPVGAYKLVVTDNASCHTLTVEEIIISQPESPEVTLAPFEAVYENTAPFVLTGGLPEGGVYSGVGVEDGMFYPAVAGMGGHMITYTYTDENGCVGSAEQEILVGPPYNPCPTPEIVYEVQHVSCPGGDDGVISVWVTGLQKPYDIQCLIFGCEPECEDCEVPNTKNQSPGFFMAGGLTAGWYTYRVVKDGCEYEICIEVTEPLPLEASAEAIDALCYGEAGSAVITISGGTMPYTLSWGETSVTLEMDETEYTINGLLAGSYSVTVSEANDCGDVVVDFTIGQPEELLASVETGSIACFGGTTSAYVSVVGGTAPYALMNGEEVAVAEFNGQTQIDNLLAGDYLWTVVDANGCEFELEFTIEQPEELEVAYSHEDILCHGGTVDVMVSATGGTAPYELFDGEVLAGALVDGAIVVNVGAGSYNWTVIDANGCEAGLEFSISQPEILVAGYAFEAIACNGGETEVTVTAQGGTAPYELFDGEVLAGELIDGAISLTVGAGSYTWTVVDANGCEDEVSFTVTEPELLVAGYDYEAILCFEGNTDVTVTATGGTAPYELYDGEVLAGAFIDGVIVVNVDAGDYSWTVVDANGCEAEVIFTVIEPELLVAGYDFEAIACFEGTTDVTVTAEGGTAPYELYDGEVLAGALIDGEIVVTVGAGNYSWTVVDANGCEADVVFTVTEPELLVAGYAFDAIACNGGETEVTVTAQGGTAPYELFDGEVLAGALVDGAISLTVGAGSYTWTVVDANNCEAEVSFTIYEPELLVAGYDFEAIDCNGGTTDVTVTAEGGTLPYTLMNGDVEVAQFNDFTVVADLPAGDYMWTVVDANGCEAEVSFTLVEPTALSLELNSPEILCAPEPTPGDCYAFEVIEFVQGLQKNGQPVVADRSNPAKALGAPDMSNAAGGFVSLGFGGHIVLGFQYPIINGPGADLAIYETSFGAPSCQSYPEKAMVYGWDEDAEGWVVLNGGMAICLDAQIDLAPLASTSKIKIVDVSNPASFGGNTDGYDVDGVVCLNGFNAGEGPGEITAEVEGGTPPYTYAWSNGETTQTISGLFSGDYSVVVTDANGCSIEASYTIVIPDPIVATTETVNVTCFGLLDGSALINITGGTLPYTLEWAGQEAFEIEGGSYLIEGLGAGVYTVYIIDGNGCPAQVTFIIEQPELLEASESFEAIACFGELTDVTVTAQGGTAPYALFDGETLVANFDMSTLLEGLGAGAYSWIVKDANGCEALVAFEITQPDQLMAGYDFEAILCHGELTDVTVTAEGGTGEYSLFSGETLVAQFTSSYVVEGLGANAYSWTVVDENGCVAVIEFEITEPALLVAGYDFEEILCNGDLIDVTVTAEGGVAPYALFDGEVKVADFDAFFVVEGLGAGDYSWVVKDANNCEAPVSFTLIEPELLVAGYDFEDILCFEGTTDVIVTAEGGTAPYTLFDGETMVAELTEGAFVVENLGAGVYSWTIVDANGCVATIDFELTQPDALIANAVVTHPLCYGEAGMVDITVEGGTLPYTIMWTIDPDAVFAGIYTIAVVDANQCMTEVSFEVIQPELLTAEVDYAEILCHGGTTDVEVSAMGGTGLYSLMDGETLVAQFETAYTVEGLGAGSYSWTVVDANGCEVPVEFTLEQPEVIEVVVVSVIEPLCFDDPTGSLEVTASGGTGALMFSIDGENYQASGLFENLMAGTYTVYVKDANDCVVTEEVIINNPPKIEIIVTPFDVTCFGANDGSILVQVINPGAGLAVLCLSVGCDIPCEDCPENKGLTAQYSGLAPGIYQITYVDQNGCVYTECVEIGEPELLVAGIESKVDVACYGEATGEATVAVSGGTAEYTYLWSNGQTTATATGLMAGTYTVVVTDANGCVAETEVTIAQPEFALSAYIEILDNVACFGGADGSAIVYAVGGVMPYTYLWSNGAATQQADMLASGMVEVTVTDANGCVFVAETYIAEPVQLSAAIQLENVVCEIDPSPAYASEWLLYLPGTNNLGGAVVAGRDNPAAALGAPDNTNAAGGFVALGFGGKLILKFAAPFVNGDGADLYVAETTFGNQTCNSYPEKVRVFVAQMIDESDPLNDPNWVDLGQGCLDSYFSMPLDLPWAQYIKLVDESNPASFPASNTSDGYDVDGIIALNGTLNVSADVIIDVVGGTPSYNFGGEGLNSNLYGVGFGSYSLSVTDANGCVAFASIDFFDCVIGDPANSILTDENNFSSNNSEVMLTAYPNPFANEATISFQLPEAAFVTLEVYNLIGEKVAVLFEGNVSAMQTQKVKFNAQSMPTGVYFYRLNAGNESFFNKIILTR